MCDSGYERIENYIFLRKNKLKSFIKLSNYETSKTRKHKQDIRKYENMDFNEEKDFYICANGKKLIRQKNQLHKKKTGFVGELKVYKCFEYKNCPFSKACQKHSKHDNPQTKTIKYSEAFQVLRKESCENITSREGIDERLNRSIQAEEIFSKLKEGLKYHRFRHRGLKARLCDITLAALGLNLNEIHRKLLKNKTEVIKYKHVA